MTPEDLDRLWRGRITARCGGADFDKQGGYAFSNMIRAEEELAQANRPGEPGSALLALSVADPTWKMPAGAMLAMLDYYYRCPWATRYPDNQGVRVCEAADILSDTHEQLASWLNMRFEQSPTDFTPDWVQYQWGAIKHALARIIPTLLLDENAQLVFPEPGYGVMTSPKNCNGAEIISRPLVIHNDRWEIDFGVINNIFSIPPQGNRVFYVNRPHNPTGRGYTREEWQNLFQWALTHGVTLVVDEAYDGIRYDDQTCSALDVDGWETCCIVLGSVSKPWSATGLRFGWIVAHPTMIKAIREILDVDDSGMFGPSIVAGLTCLQHPEWALATRERYRQLHQALFDGLERSGFTAAMPEGGLCQVTPAPKAAGGQEFADADACAKWMREELRISVMPQTIGSDPFLRWAVTLMPVPECGLDNDEDVIVEVVKRLKVTPFEF